MSIASIRPPEVLESIGLLLVDGRGRRRTWDYDTLRQPDRRDVAAAFLGRAVALRVRDSGRLYTGTVLAVTRAIPGAFGTSVTNALILAAPGSEGTADAVELDTITAIEENAQ